MAKLPGPSLVWFDHGRISHYRDVLPCGPLKSSPKFTKTKKTDGSPLYAYNIVIHEQDQDQFFGGQLPVYAGPVGFVEHEDRVQGLDAPSLALIKRLDLAMKILDSEESAVDDFAAELLRAILRWAQLRFTLGYRAL
jgi:hypothetical protein